MFVTVDSHYEMEWTATGGRIDVKIIRNVFDGGRMPMLLNNGMGEILKHSSNPSMNLPLIYFYFYLK